MVRRLSALSAIAVTCGLLFAAPSFATSYPVTVTLAGTGTGTVVGGGGTINCPGDCSEPNYSSGSPLSLTATATASSTFAGWTGACSSAGISPTCDLIVTGDTNIGATFNAVPVVPAPTAHKKKCKKKHRAASVAKKKCKKGKRP